MKVKSWTPTSCQLAVTDLDAPQPGVFLSARIVRHANNAVFKPALHRVTRATAGPLQKALRYRGINTILTSGVPNQFFCNNMLSERLQLTRCFGKLKSEVGCCRPFGPQKAARRCIWRRIIGSLLLYIPNSPVTLLLYYQCSQLRLPLTSPRLRAATNFLAGGSTAE